MVKINAIHLPLMAGHSRVTDSTKINSGLFMYCKTKYFWKTLIEVFSPHLYASFGTFYVQIGQSFAAQWVFKQSEEFRNRRNFSSMRAICRFSKILQRLTVPRKIYQFWRKRYQKSVKIGTTNFYKNFFKDILFYMSSRLSKIRSVHTYVMPRTAYFAWICRLWQNDELIMLEIWIVAQIRAFFTKSFKSLILKAWSVSKIVKKTIQFSEFKIHFREHLTEKNNFWKKLDTSLVNPVKYLAHCGKGNPITWHTRW